MGEAGITGAQMGHLPRHRPRLSALPGAPRLLTAPRHHHQSLTNLSFSLLHRLVVVFYQVLVLVGWCVVKKACGLVCGEGGLWGGVL